MHRIAATLLLLCADPAAAEEPEAVEEITVWGDHPVREARLEVVEALEAEGYRLDRSKDGKDIFVAPEAYKPKVVLDRDGYLVTRRRNLVWVGADGHANEKTFEKEDLVCILWPPACLSTRGAQISKKKMTGESREVKTAIAPQMAAYREVLQQEGHRDRLHRLLPRQLDQLWFEGVGPDGRELATPLARRDAIVELWLTRVDDVWGDEAREVIEHFLADHVQDTEWALTEAEIAAIDRRYDRRRSFAFGPQAAEATVAAKVETVETEAVVRSEPAPSAPLSPAAAAAIDRVLVGPLAAPARTSPFDVAPLGAPTRPHPLEWLRGTEEDAVEAEAVAPDPPDER